MQNQPIRLCCVCLAHDWTLIFNAHDNMHGMPGSWGIWRCRCGTQLTDPVPSNINEYYPHNYYTYQPPVQRNQSTLLRHCYQSQVTFKLLSLVMRGLYGPGPVPKFRPDGNVLDIGCGSGQWLMKMATLGWDVAGVEPNHQAVEAANRTGLNVQQGTIETVTYPDQSFDVVRIWHVLEHVEDPLEILKAAYGLLKPEGQLILGVPNNAGILARLAGPYWFDLDAPRHRWHWNPMGLRILVERAGFSEVQVGVGYYGGLPSIRSLLYGLESKIPRFTRYRSAMFNMLHWIRRIPPLHLMWWLIEWTNYLELSAYRPIK